MNSFLKMFRLGGLKTSQVLKNNLGPILAVSALLVTLGVIWVGTNYKDVSNLTSGTLNDARLSANVARLNNPRQEFSGQIKAQSFVGSLQGNANSATSLVLKPADCTAGAFASAIDKLGNLGCSYDGSSLANLNAAKVSSGTLNDTLLSTNIPRLDGLSVIFKGKVTAASFAGNFLGNIDGNVSGSAASFTSTLAGDVTGTQNTTIVTHVSDSAVSSNIAKYSDPGPTFTHGLTAASFSGDGANITNINGSNVSSAVANATNSVNSSNVSGGTITAETITNTTIDSTVTGNGSGLTNIIAATLGTHVASDFVLRDGSLAMVGPLNLGGNNIANVATLTATTLNGDGSGITGISAGQLVDGSDLPRLGLNVGELTNTYVNQQIINVDGVDALSVQQPGVGGIVVFHVDTDTPKITLGAPLDLGLNNIVNVGSISASSIGTTSLSASGAVDFASASSLVIPITAADLSGGGVCSPGALTYSSHDSSFYACKAGSWILAF